jgi:hypothetical protein
MSAIDEMIAPAKDLSDLHSRIGATNLRQAIETNEQPWQPAPAVSPTVAASLPASSPVANEPAGAPPPTSGPSDPSRPPGGLTIKSLSEILASSHDDSDMILGDRLIAQGQSCVLAGASGLGKSRLALQMACALACGGDFLGFVNHAGPLKVLMLQTENSERRLKMDVDRLEDHYHCEWETISQNLRVMTPFNDNDYLLNLDDVANVSRIGDTVERENPDVLFLDPLNVFAAGDLNTDSDMRETCRVIGEIGRRGNPDRAVIVLHHALTGKAGAVKATGYDRTSFGRNSKVLLAWSRAQINLAPADPDSNDRLAVICGKNSNGPEFAPFGVNLNSATMIYGLDPDFDLEGWKSEIAGRTSSGPRVSTAEVVEILGTARLAKPELIKALMDEMGCGKSKAYALVAKAEREGLISRCEREKTYRRP